MKFAGCEKKIVVSLRRELNQTAFGSPAHQRDAFKIVQQLAVQITGLLLEILQTLSAKTLYLLLHPEILWK